MSPILTRMIGAGSAGSGFGFGRRRGGPSGPSFSATGGTVTTYNSSTIHTFTAPGTFTVSAGTGLVEYVVVAGGGAGGCQGGGGGAGGFRTGSEPVSPGPYSITVGPGGGGNSDRYTLGANGSPSVFGPGPITSTGGGGGGARFSPAVSPGGSGGGTNLHTPGSAGTGIPGQGFPGALGIGPAPVGFELNGGGGGAGGAGQVGPTSPARGGAGGIGAQVPATFRNPAVYYDPANQWYLAGGGGGGAEGSVAGSPGGAGGGGGGSQPTSPGIGNPGIINTGSGGGGSSNGQLSGNGGSGIVIIAYPS